MRNQLWMIAGLLAVAMLAVPAWSQELPPTTTAPSVSPTGDAATEPAKETTAEEDLTKVLENMTPEQLQELIKQSAKMRLTAERKQVVAEIEASLTIDPAHKGGAVKELDGAENTQKDNIDRICKAFAKTDERFGAAYKLYKDNKFTEAAEALKKIANVKEVNYFGATKSYLLGDALMRAGLPDLGNADAKKDLAARTTIWEAVDTYVDMLENMPDRVSFSASAAINCADAYEKLGRGIYAMEMYTFCVKNFALTLDKAQVDVIAEKVDKLTNIYQDPMLTISKMMGDVADRLDKTDSGKTTQGKQGEIVMILKDLIATIEEKQNAQSKPQPKPQRGERKPGEGQGQGQGEGEGQGQGQGQGKSPKGGKPNGTNKPSSGANVSALPGGGGGRNTRVSSVNSGKEANDWAEMAPREREKIQEASKKVMSEKYRDIVRDYYLRLAEEGNK